jgi:hypothetical protein
MDEDIHLSFSRFL